MALQRPTTDLNPRQTYSVSETAVILGVSIATAYNAVRKGDIRATRILGRYVVPVAEIDRLLQRTPDKERDRHDD
jgi:excisionase family DNA binding protein